MGYRGSKDSKDYAELAEIMAAIPALLRQIERNRHHRRTPHPYDIFKGGHDDNRDVLRMPPNQDTTE